MDIPLPDRSRLDPFDIFPLVLYPEQTLQSVGHQMVEDYIRQLDLYLDLLVLEIEPFVVVLESLIKSASVQKRGYLFGEKSDQSVFLNLGESLVVQEPGHLDEGVVLEGDEAAHESAPVDHLLAGPGSQLGDSGLLDDLEDAAPVFEGQRKSLESVDPEGIETLVETVKHQLVVDVFHLHLEWIIVELVPFILDLLVL